MNKLIKIEIKNSNVLRMNYVMTRSCTYSCRYCPEDLNAGTHKNVDLEELRDFLLRFTNRDRLLQITGGECTTHPQFKDVISIAKQAGYKVLVDSNSVRSLRFYQEVKDLVDNWCITLHPSQHKLDLKKLELLSANSFLVVYVMMDPQHWSKSVDWFNQVSTLKDLKVTPVRIQNNWAGASFTAEYNADQLEFLSNSQSKWLFTAEREQTLRKTHSWLADTISIATYQDGQTTDLDAFEIIRKKQNNFFGWRCKAGSVSLCIYDNGFTTWANCGMKTFNHFRDVYPKDLEEEMTCRFLECGCGTDVRATKYLPLQIDR